MKYSFLSIPAIALLTACGGSSSGGGTSVTNPISTPAFSTAEGALAELQGFNERAADLELTNISNIPVSGSATYDGVFSLGRIEERFPGDPDPDLVEPLIGELALDVDFANNTVSGGADNFFGPTSAVAGSVTFSEGEIARDDTSALFVAELDGSLPFDGSQRDIEGGILGVFVGDTANSLTGLVVAEADGGLSLIGAILAED